MKIEQLNHQKTLHRGIILHSIINAKAEISKIYPILAKKYGAWPLYQYALTMQQEQIKTAQNH